MSDLPFAFYLPENSAFTILDSALASAHFAVAVCDDPGDGTLRCQSITAIQDGSLERLRGRLVEGVGYCADAVFAAHWFQRFGRLLRSDQLTAAGERIGMHTLQTGFFDDPSLPVRLYRDVETGEFLDNLEAREGYLEPGHIGRVAHQLAQWHDLATDPDLRARLRSIAVRTAAWLMKVERCGNGWYPRRCTPDGRVFANGRQGYGRLSSPGEQPMDPIFDRSGAGVLIIQLLADVLRRGWLDATEELRADIAAFTESGGHFGSTNTDTEDLSENVSYAMAFQALHDASTVLDDASIKAFAYERCLDGLRQFEMTADANGLDTKGLLWMEASWNSACMWEIAEAAQAYLVAYGDTFDRGYVVKALTMLRAMAKHHHGPLGMLTEAVDWDGHSTHERHFDGERFSDIRETHPFLNNLHILEPTVTYLERFADRGPSADGISIGFFDLERNLLGPVEIRHFDWLF